MKELSISTKSPLENVNLPRNQKKNSNLGIENKTMMLADN